MAVPDFQEYFTVLLRISRDGKEYSTRDVRGLIADKFELSAEDLDEKLPSGTTTKFLNRLNWAIVYLVKAGALVRPRRAHFQITARGIALLDSATGPIKVRQLNQFPEFKSFHSSYPKSPDVDSGDEATLTPGELLVDSY